MSGIAVATSVVGPHVIVGTGVIVGRTMAGSKGFTHPARRDTAQQRQMSERRILMV